MRLIGWPHLRWTDALIPPSLEGLEGTHFTPLALDNPPDTMTRLLTTRLTSEVFNLMVESRAKFSWKIFAISQGRRDIGAGLVNKG